MKRHVAGVIFDMDDTLLVSKSAGLHIESRLLATRQVGAQYNIPYLAHVTEAQSLQAFMSAPHHTLEDAIWNTLRMAGCVTEAEIDKTNTLYSEILQAKNHMFVQLLFERGEEVLGASGFIKKLAANGLSGKLAIATNARLLEVIAFLDKMQLSEFFARDRIKTRESVQNIKPDPEIYEQAFASLGLPEADRQFVLAVEDHPKGIMAAAGAGLFTCGIATRLTKTELQQLPTPPAMIADSYEQLAQQLFGSD